MNTTLNLYLFAFTVPLIMFACSAPQTDAAAPPQQTASLATLTPAPPALTTIANPQSVPKQNDLIFVEFFAVT